MNTIFMYQGVQSITTFRTFPIVFTDHQNKRTDLGKIYFIATFLNKFQLNLFSFVLSSSEKPTSVQYLNENHD